MAEPITGTNPRRNKPRPTHLCIKCSAPVQACRGAQKYCGACKPSEKEVWDAWYAKNKDRISKKRSELWKTNYVPKTHMTCKDCGLSVRRTSSKQVRCISCSRPARSEYLKQRRLANLDAHRKAGRKAAALRLKCPIKRLHANASRMVRYCLRSVGGKAGTSLARVLGYTAADLAKHIERQFVPGMSWENMGEWEIDHIRPISSFDIKLKQDEAFQECWALANLRPLWRQENRAKSGVRVHLI